MLTIISQVLPLNFACFLPGFNVGTSNNRGEKREINKEICHLPGFTALQWLLPKQAHVAELYFLLMALLLGQPVRKLPEKLHFDLDSVWTFIFGVPASQPAAIKKRSSKAELCPEGALVILSMARNMLNQVGAGTFGFSILVAFSAIM